MPQATALAENFAPTNYCLTPSLLKPKQRFELLSLHIGEQHTEALFFARHDSLITSKFPGFEKKLLQILPNLLKNVKCYNGNNHHFATEMLATETGHLYEHIWLEVLCCEKLRYATTAHYAGETSWNWRQEPRGLFHITLQANRQDQELILNTARISMQIMGQVFT